MKGIFYSAITILFVAPILVVAFVYVNSLDTYSKIDTSKTVGDKVASYSKSVNSDLPRAMKIISRRSIDTNLNYIDLTGVPLDNAEARISETIHNGTVFGNSTVVNNFTITNWANSITAKGSSYGFATNVSVIGVNITPLDSYHVLVHTVVSVNVTDVTSSTNLYRIYSVGIPISIEGLLDPLYTLNTNGLLKRVIQSPNITVYGVANFDNAVFYEYYMPSIAGPSFLDRMEGRLSSKYAVQGIGLESVVYLPELQAAGLTIKSGQNTFDYLYFSNLSQSGQSVNGTAYAWVQANSGQAATYGLTLI